MKKIAVYNKETGAIRAITNIGLNVGQNEELLIADSVSVQHYIKDGMLLLWDGPIGDPSIDNLYTSRFPFLVSKEESK